MLFNTLLSAALCAFAAARAIAPPQKSNDTSAIFARDTVLANGNSVQQGTLAGGLRWQSSGVLVQGGCTGIQHISDCYELELGSDPRKQLDPGFPTPRQRVEFASPHADDGTSWKYTWKSYLPASDTGSDSFFHIMQIFSAAIDAPVYFLDILQGDVAFREAQTEKVLATASLAAILATPLQHSLTATYGPSGRLNYVITNSQTGAFIFKYSMKGAVGSGGNYVKFGTYRQVYDGMPALKSWYGDYTVEQL